MSPEVTQRITHYTQQSWTPQYVKLLVGMRVREICAYLDAVLRPARVDARHILIFAQGRSGTTLLANLLASTGYYLDLGEPLHLWTREVWAPEHYLRGLGRRYKENVIAHVKGSQLTRGRQRPVEVATFLRNMLAEGWLIVHVRRRNVAEQVLSECVALRRGGYHKFDAVPDSIRWWIDPAEFLERYERRLGFMEQDDAALEGLSHLTISYEDDLLNAKYHQVACDRVLATVGLPSCPVRTNLHKIGGADPWRQLENRSEIAAALMARGLQGTAAPVDKPRSAAVATERE